MKITHYMLPRAVKAGQATMYLMMMVEGTTIQAQRYFKSADGIAGWMVRDTSDHSKSQLCPNVPAAKALMLKLAAEQSK